jgi:hypothetical protein
MESLGYLQKGCSNMPADSQFNTILNIIASVLTFFIVTIINLSSHIIDSKCFLISQNFYINEPEDEAMVNHCNDGSFFAFCH